MTMSTVASSNPNRSKRKIGAVGWRAKLPHGALLFTLLYTSVVTGHEYWLSPIDYTIDVGENLLVDIRNGENFVGSSFPYQSEKFNELTIVGNGVSTPIISRLGDYPAIHPTIDFPGLYSIVLSSTERALIYDEWDKFQAFLTYHGLDRYVEKHKSLRFPMSGIKEQYFRYAKTFVYAGDSDSNRFALSVQDVELLNRKHGQELEIVLTNNPLSSTRSIELELLYRGEPLANRQVELFSKDSTVQRVVTTTDALGKARFDNIIKGEHLLNAVHMVESTRRGAHWMTLWASVTLSTF